MATPALPETLTPAQQDVWIAGYAVAYVCAILDTRGDYSRPLDQILTDGLGLKRLGSGIEKTAYLLPSGTQVLKLQRWPGASLTKEQAAMAHCKAQGLPVPEQHLLHECIALSECCHAINTLDGATRQKVEREYFRVSQLFANAGMGDRHDGNFGMRADGSIVAIDIGFGIRPVSEPVPMVFVSPAAPQAPAGPCNCRRCVAMREAVALKREVQSQAARDIDNITGLGSSPDPEDNAARRSWEAARPVTAPESSPPRFVTPQQET